MNRITLTFKDSEVDKLYQKSGVYTQLQLRIFITVSLVTLIVSSISFLSTLDEIDHLYSIVAVTLCIYAMISIPIIYKYPQYSNMGLFIYNILLAFNLFELPSFYDQYIGLLIGSTQMLVHASILFIMQFHFSVINNLLICAVLVSSTSTYSSVTLFQYVFVFSIFLSFTITLYVLEKTKRQQFLSTVRDNTVDMLFTKFIKKPFIIFSYNSHQHKFEIFMKKSKENLDFILENAYYKKQKLKKYIYQRISFIQQQQQIVEEERYIAVTYLNEKHIIKFECFEYYYMISFETMEEFVMEITELHQKRLQNIQDYMISVFRRLASLIKINNKEMLIKLKFSIYQLVKYTNLISPIKQCSFVNFDQPINSLEVVDVGRQLKKIIKFIKSKGKLKINLLIQQNLELLCSKDLLLIYLLELFKHIKINKPLTIKSFLIGTKIHLEFTNCLKLPDTQVYKELSKLLVESVSLFDDKLTVIFKEQFDVSFSCKLFARQA